MGEPKKAGRGKSIADIAVQLNRAWVNLGRNGSEARRDVLRRAYLDYQQNMLSSPTMKRAMKEAGADTDEKRSLFLSSFGRGMEIRIPISEYRRRKNNRN